LQPPFLAKKSIWTDPTAFHMAGNWTAWIVLGNIWLAAHGLGCYLPTSPPFRVQTEANRGLKKVKYWISPTSELNSKMHKTHDLMKGYLSGNLTNV
jgi:hypothetical protein